MQPKLYSKLYEAIEKFLNDNCETDEYQALDFYSPDNMGLHMTNAAATVFDGIVEASKFAEYEASAT
jgi:hypothetical protein